VQYQTGLVWISPANTPVLNHGWLDVHHRNAISRQLYREDGTPSAIRGVQLIEQEVAETVGHQGVAQPLHALWDVRAMSDDKQSACLDEIAGDRLLAKARLSLVFPAPVDSHRHDPSIHSRARHCLDGMT
jgi:hypothetical protein